METTTKTSLYLSSDTKITHHLTQQLTQPGSGADDRAGSAGGGCVLGSFLGSADHQSSGQPHLKRTIDWVCLTIIGVSYVISGEFAGWNAGLSDGFMPFIVAFGLVSVFYLSFGICMCELSAALPVAGGGYTFAREAIGNTGGFVTGLIVLIEYICVAGAIAIFTTVYISQFVDQFMKRDLPLWAILLALYASCSAMHSYGVGEAVNVLSVITGLAVVGLVAFYIAAGLRFELSFFSAREGITLDAIWHAIPYAMWFYLAVEGVPLAAEEALHPEKTVPKGYVASWLCLFVFGFLTTVMTVGSLGLPRTSISASPLVEALQTSNGHHTVMSITVTVIGLFGLLSSLFAVIYGYSRLTFALARAQFLPQILSTLNRRKAPYLAVCIPSVVTFAVSLAALAICSWVASAGGNLLLQSSVMAAALSYAFIMISYIILSIKRPYLNRPYKALCFVPVVATITCAIVTFAVFANGDWRASVMVGGWLALAIVYYLTIGRNKVVVSEFLESGSYSELTASTGVSTLNPLD